MPYVTKAQIEDYPISVPLPDDDAEVARLIKDAGRDIDWHVGAWPDQDDATKFGDLTDPDYTDPYALGPAALTRLSNATACQVEYRLVMGEAFFVEDQRGEVQGPDTTEVGRVGRVGPKARAELAQGNLIKRTGRMR